MNPWGDIVATPPGVICLAELSLLVAERTRFEQAGVPRISAVEVGKPSGRRTRRHTYSSGRMRTAYVGPRLDRDTT